MDRIPYYKSNLHILGASDQASVSLICAVGARSSPHSAVLGLEIPGLADGTAAPAVYLSVGSRREKACRSLTERASELCWLGGTLQASAASRGAVEMLVGLAQLLICTFDGLSCSTLACVAR